MKLTYEERQTLSWLATQRQLVWGGIYDRKGYDAVVAKLEALGLAEGVRREVKAGNSVFSGGYRITYAGRAALEASRDE